MIIKNILVPTDFTPESLNSLRYAIQLADKLGASIKVFHNIYPDQGFHEGLVVASPPARHQISDTLKRIRQFVGKALPPLEATRALERPPRISCEARLGIPAANIARIAAEEGIDLIVMSSKPAASFWTKITGSTPAEVVGRAVCPVLFVPEGTEFKGVERLVFAADLDESTPFKLWKAVMTLRQFRPRISFAHVGWDDLPQDTLDNLMLFIKQNPLLKDVSFIELKGHHIARRLEDYAEEENFDMVAIQSARKKLWERLFVQSNARDLVYLAKLPLLVLR